MSDRPAGWIAAAVAAAVGLGTTGHHGQTQAPVTVVLNGQAIYSGPATFRNDRVLYPLNFGQGAGVVAYYDEEHQIGVLHRGDENIAVKADSPLFLAFLSQGDAWLEGGDLGLPFDPLEVTAETPPQEHKGELFVPIRVLAAALNVNPNTDVQWDEKARTVYVAAPGVQPSAVSNGTKSFSAPPFLIEAFNAEAGETSTAEAEEEAEEATTEEASIPSDWPAGVPYTPENIEHVQAGCTGMASGRCSYIGECKGQ